MPEEDGSAQESGVANEFEGINPEDVMALISGSVEEIDAPGSTGNDPGNFDPANNNGNGEKISISAKELEQIIQQGISSGLKGANKANQGNNAGNPNQTQGDFLQNYESQLAKSYAEKHGLNESGAKFMAATTMEAVRPLLGMMAKGFQQLSQRDEDMARQSTLSELDRNLESWLDKKGITDTQDREDVIAMAKWRTSQIEGADQDTFRAEFEKAASRVLERMQEDEDEENAEETNNPGRRIPPVVRNGKIGFDDIVQRVVKSKDPRDDIGGDRFLSLAERMISSGMRGGGV